MKIHQDFYLFYRCLTKINFDILNKNSIIKEYPFLTLSQMFSLYFSLSPIIIGSKFASIFPIYLS
jgi:hypothetical protein